ncbi:oligosaccharide flippase family protein [Nocardioides sp. Y6]|uniref:Oligosaccharide flippase family protein n=1 Tax=Nocardioides malaquae TaxID=2773426 RepID=A0ABR9RTE7_9ACTN|nr:oligosaccharide flippase family protein [Nocardioides malaquae]MBE7324831.1 oligosaccharide flippase family protein [Nocardioides malaquae]
MSWRSCGTAIADVDGRRGAVGMRAGFFSLLGVVTSGGFRFLVNLVIGRVAGPAVLAQTASILSLAQISTLLGPSSLGAAMTRNISVARTTGPPGEADRIRAHVWRMLWVRALWIAPLALGAYAVVYRPSVTAVAVLLPVLVSLGVYQVAKAELLGDFAFRKVAVIEVAGVVVGVASLVALVVSGVRDARLLLPVVVSGVIFVVARGRVRRPEARLPVEKQRELREFVRLGIVGTLVSAGFMHVSVLLAVHVGGEVGGGMYVAAFTLATPLAMFTTAMGSVVLPHLSALATRHGERLLRALPMSQLMAWSVGSLLGLVMLFSDEVVALVWGAAYAESADLYPLVLGAICMTAIGMPTSIALTAAGNDGMRISARLGALGACTGAIVWLLTVSGLDVTGVAVGYLTAATVTSVAPLFFVHRLAGKRMHVRRLWPWGWGALLIAAGLLREQFSAVTVFGIASVLVVAAVLGSAGGVRRLRGV